MTTQETCSHLEVVFLHLVLLQLAGQDEHVPVGAGLQPAGLDPALPVRGVPGDCHPVRLHHNVRLSFPSGAIICPGEQHHGGD